MNIRYFGLDLVRQFRNARSLVFTFAVPVVMLLIFGGAYGSQTDTVTGLPWIIVTTVQMAGYGAMMAALSQAFNIVNERSVGWNRQLRITPLSGFGYLVTKITAALAVGLVSMLIIGAISIIVLHAKLSIAGWLMAGLGIWVGIIPFALIAILIGQFARPEFAQPLFMVTFLSLSILGGLWVPLSILPSWVANVAQVVPSYWLNRLGQMGASLSGNAMLPAAVLIGWTVALGALITWRYRRDAARA
ncbi:MAG: transporter permease [Glaciihabitans sp.]|jgi:ABC-2 type transport system permease protein|nr:transporter permease [Glaciihabitans sp.]MDQ1571697.1 type transport system permease protein [Actinomycetota bacterium]